MTSLKGSLIFFMMLSVTVFFLSDGASAATAPIARVTKLSGEMRVKSQTKQPVGSWVRVLKEGYEIYNGDEIKVFGAASATVTFTDKSVLNLSENTTMSIEERETKKKLFGFTRLGDINRNIKVLQGRLHAVINKSQGKWTSFESKVATAGIRGTTITLNVDGAGNMQFGCDEGFVEMTNSDGSVTLKLDSGKEVKLKKEAGKLVAQSVSGDIKINAGNTTINLGNKGAVAIGGTGDKLQIDVPQGTPGSVSLTSGNTTLNMTPGDGVSLTATPGSNQVGIDVTSGSVDAKIGDQTKTLGSDDPILIIDTPQQTEPSPGAETQPTGPMYTIEEDTTTGNSPTTIIAPVEEGPPS